MTHAETEARIQTLIFSLHRSEFPKAAELAELWEAQRLEFRAVIETMAKLYLPLEEDIMLPNGRPITIKWSGQPSRQDVEFLAMYMSLKHKYMGEPDAPRPDARADAIKASEEASG